MDYLIFAVRDSPLWQIACNYQNACFSTRKLSELLPKATIPENYIALAPLDIYQGIIGFNYVECSVVVISAQVCPVAPPQPDLECTKEHGLEIALQRIVPTCLVARNLEAYFLKTGWAGQSNTTIPFQSIHWENRHWYAKPDKLLNRYQQIPVMVLNHFHWKFQFTMIQSDKSTCNQHRSVTKPIYSDLF